MTVNVKALCAVGGLLVVVAALVGSATAAFRGGSVASYTGCRNAKSGALYSVAPGDAPVKPCKKGDSTIGLSGGDVTAVAAGVGLTGGGGDGDVSVGLDPKFALPQSCSNGQVPKASGAGWACGADQGNAYTAGDGLELSGNEFRLKGCGNGETPRYTIPGGWVCVKYALASQSCPPGQYASSITSGGLLSCLAPAGASGGVSVYFGKEVNPTQGGVEDDHVGIPSDDVARPYAFTTVPPGTYLVNATGRIFSDHNVGVGYVYCRLNDVADRRDWNDEMLNDDGLEGSFSLQGLVTSPGGALSLICAATALAPGISLHQARISALKVG